MLAYDSFAELALILMGKTPKKHMHLAIGDVDDLRGYVTSQKAENEYLFGHVAGNDCMRRVGRAVCSWWGTEFKEWDDLICGTFGGDEVIVLARGGVRSDFGAALSRLGRAINLSAPRPCSFSWTSIDASTRRDATPVVEFRKIVSALDHHLFMQKSRKHAAGILVTGEIHEMLKSNGDQQWIG